GTGPSRHTIAVLGPSIARLMPQKTRLSVPVDGVFIGVSNFAPRANKVPTPAHTLGAALAYSVFLQAKARTAQGNSPEPISSRDTHLELLTDLRLDPNDSTWQAARISEMLKSLPGIEVRDYSKDYGLRTGELWPYMPGKHRLSKAGILDAAREQ